MTVEYHGYIIENKIGDNKHFYVIWKGNRYNKCFSVRKVIKLIETWEA